MPTPRAAKRKRKPTMGVFKFASCDGCQLTLLDLEEHLLEIADAVDIAYFREGGDHVRAACERIGRDPATITVSVNVS